MKTKAEIGVMLLEAKENQEPLEAVGSRKDSSLEVLESMAQLML